jgi:MBG domain (YGX type)/Bacterial Ig-like domain (group 3)/Chlamydia polymorphic membrane protein (Chlamydia_PMP) repeat
MGMLKPSHLLGARRQSATARVRGQVLPRSRRRRPGPRIGTASVRLLTASLLTLGLAALGWAAPVYAATTVHDCPATEAALSSDIASAGNGGTVAFNCATAITIPFTSTITIASSTTLDASGSTGAVAFDGGGAVELFVVNGSASFTVNTLTLQNGYTQYAEGAIRGIGTVTILNSTLSGNGGYGAVDNEYGNTLTITNSTFSGNSGTYGGAVAQNSPSSRPGGTTNITNSTFSSNTAGPPTTSAEGAAIYTARGTVNVTGSTFSGNTAAYAGGAIENQATVNVDSSTFSGNSTHGSGGAISTGGSGATTTLTNSTVSSNSANQGAALDNESGATTNVSNSSLSSNSAGNGGAIYNFGYTGSTATVNVTNSTLASNTATTWGGAIYSYSPYSANTGKLTITASTFSKNKAPYGGAITNYGIGSALAVGNSTFSGNTATANYGGAIFNYTSSTATITNSTFSANSGSLGTALSNYGSTATVGASIFSSSTGAPCYNVSGTRVDSGNNLESDAAASCGFSASLHHDIVGQSPLLGATLADNGGPTQTLTLASGSPAVDYIPTSSGLCPATDQRGSARPDAGESACDIGAYEFQDQATSTALGSSQNPSSSGQAVTFTATVSPQSGTATPTGTVQFQIDGTNLGSPVTLSSGVAQSPSVSTLGASGSPHTITASYTPGSGSGFAASSNTLSQAVAGKADQTITFTAPSGVSYGDADSDLGATASSGIAVSYSSTTTSVCTIVSGELHVVAAGSCTIDADQAGDGSYNAAPQVEQTFTIGKGDQGISFAAPTGVTSGAADFDLGATASSGLAVSYSSKTTSVCTIVSGELHVLAAGSCTIDADQAGDGNYNPAPQVEQTFTIGKADQTITFTAPSGISYAAADSDLGATASSGLAVSYSSKTTSICTIVSGKLHVLAAGSCTVDADQAGDGNYNPAPQIERTFAIAKAALTVTAADKSVQYSDQLPTLSVTYSGFVNNEGASVLGGTLACITTATVTNGKVLSAAGIYGIACSGLSATNYSITNQPGTLTVTREDTVVRLAQNDPHAVQVDTSGANKGNAPAMTFSARITEVSDGSYGDISKAKPVTFTLSPIGAGSTITCAGSVTQLQPATATSPGFEIAGCTVPAGTRINVYEVAVSVGGNYYQGSDDSVLTVYDPSAGGSNGAGTITNPKTGNQADISYSASSLKNGQVQGKFLYIQRDAAANVLHVLKGNVISTMAISAKTATITGKATLDGVGNYSYILTAIDNGNPNPTTNPDQYGQQISDPSGSPVGSLSFTTVNLSNGNIFVGK